MGTKILYVYAIVAKEAGIRLGRFRPEKARCFVASTVMMGYTA